MDYKRLTTDYPQGNYETLHNMTVVKDKEVWLREFEEGKDISLVDYCKRQCQEECNVLPVGSAHEFGEYMDCECVVAYFYWMAVGHAELRERLKQYEDSGLSPKETRELMTNG